MKRFFVLPEYRGTGVADALITALIEPGSTDEVFAGRSVQFLMWSSP